MKIKNVYIYELRRGKSIDVTDEFFEDNNDKNDFIEDINNLKALNREALQDLLVYYNTTFIFYSSNIRTENYIDLKNQKIVFPYQVDYNGFKHGLKVVLEC